jgi:hypothetical protein
MEGSMGRSVIIFLVQMNITRARTTAFDLLSVSADPLDACDEIARCDGNILLAQRGGCSFADKLSNAHKIQGPLPL